MKRRRIIPHVHEDDAGVLRAGHRRQARAVCDYVRVKGFLVGDAPQLAVDHQEIFEHVSPLLELRRLTLRNGSRRPRRIEVTSLIEIALADPAAHAVRSEVLVFHVTILPVERRPVTKGRRSPRRDPAAA